MIAKYSSSSSPVPQPRSRTAQPAPEGELLGGKAQKLPRRGYTAQLVRVVFIKAAVKELVHSFKHTLPPIPPRKGREAIVAQSARAYSNEFCGGAFQEGRAVLKYDLNKV